MFFSLFRQREGTKRDHVARFESEQITILKNCAAGLAALRQVLAPSSMPFSVVAFLTCIFRYCNKDNNH
jgi:hypothetical protein